MASIEAVECLELGGAPWDKYVQDSVRPIDLTFANLHGVDLSNRRFIRCDLTGARMNSANLDRSVFIDCILTGATLVNASLVDCHMTRVAAQTIQLNHSVLRNCKLDDVDLTGSNAAEVQIQDSELINCRLTEAVLDDASLRRASLVRVTFGGITCDSLHAIECHFMNCSINRWSVQEIRLEECTFERSRLQEWLLNGGYLRDCKMTRCTIRRLAVGTTAVARLDLSHSVLIGVHVAGIDPSTAILLDTAFVSCTWPIQTGKVHWSGRYEPSPWLVAHPIQDVRGVPPTIRRDIADAQYLVATLSSATGLSRVLLRVWGATSAYGQSLFRLTVCSALLIFLHAVALLGSRHEIRVTELNLDPLISQIGITAKAFLGLLGETQGPTGWFEGAILISARVSGFLGLGTWITIAANKVTRLARE